MSICTCMYLIRFLGYCDFQFQTLAHMEPITGYWKGYLIFHCPIELKICVCVIELQFPHPSLGNRSVSGFSDDIALRITSPHSVAVY